jgi:hypothetical protein
MSDSSTAQSHGAKIYVASSWRNERHPGVVELLRVLGHEVYDFRNASSSFDFSQLGESWQQLCTPEHFRKSLEHPLAQRGFQADMDAMKWADLCVLVLPCGRSAHLEAGWFIGAGKPCLILLADGATPELMYKMATTTNARSVAYEPICVSMEEVREAISALLKCKQCGGCTRAGCTCCFCPEPVQA